MRLPILFLFLIISCATGQMQATRPQRDFDPALPRSVLCLFGSYRSARSLIANPESAGLLNRPGMREVRTDDRYDCRVGTEPSAVAPGQMQVCLLGSYRSARSLIANPESA